MQTYYSSTATCRNWGLWLKAQFIGVLLTLVALMLSGSAYAQLSLSSTAPPTAIVNTPYAGHTFTASGGTGTYRYWHVGGQLPTGLSLNGTTGQLSGTPSEAGAFFFTLEVRDGQTTAQRSFGMAVRPNGAGPFNLPLRGTGGEGFQVYDAPTGGNLLATPTTNIQNDVATAINSGLALPYSLVRDNAGNIWIANAVAAGQGRVAHWDGTTLTNVITSGLNHPTGLALDGNGHLWIASKFGPAVHRWDGSTLTTPITAGLNFPEYLAIEPNGNLLISNYGGTSVSRWNGTTLSTAIGGLQGPTALTIGANGDVYVSEFAPHNRVRRWDGTTLSTLIGSGLNGPEKVLEEGGGNFLVVDLNSNRILRWNGSTLAPVITTGLNAPYDMLRLPGGDILISNINANNVLRWRQVAQASFTLPNSTSTFYVQRTVNGSPVGERVAISAVPTLALSASAPANALEGQLYAGHTFAASGGLGTYRYFHVGGQLPTGLSLNGTTGQLSGTPSEAGVFFFTIEVRDGNSTVQRTFGMAVRPNGAGPFNLPLRGTGGEGFQVYDAPTGGSLLATPTASVQNDVTTAINSGLTLPHGMARDAAGNLWVVSAVGTGQGRVARWDGTALTNVITSGLNFPNGIVIDGNGHLLIASKTGNIVHRWDGSTLSNIITGIADPEGLALEANGNLLITAHAGGTLHRWNGSTLSTVVGGLQLPTTVTVGANGDIFVSEFAPHNRVRRLSGTTLSTLISSGVNGPERLLEEGGGNFLLADFFGDRVSRWDGTTLTPVITSGLRNPYELLRVPGGDIFISNYGLNNVLRWRQVAQASFTLPNSTSTFYVQRTVNGSPVGERVAINAFLPALSFTASTPANALEGQPYAGHTFAASGGTGTYRYFHVGGQLPTGLSLNGTSGQLSGTPSEAGVFFFTLEVRDGQTTAQRSFGISVSPCGSGPFNLPLRGTGGEGFQVYDAPTGGSLLATPTTNIQNDVTTVINSGLTLPHGMARDVAGNLWIVSAVGTGQGRVARWDGTTLSNVITSGLNFPNGIVVDGNGHLLITSKTGNTVHRWDGTSLTNIITGINDPEGLALEANGNLLITSHAGGMLHRWNGTALSTVVGGLQLPTTVTVGANGDIFVSEFAPHNRVRRWDGTTLSTLISSGVNGPERLLEEGGGNFLLADFFGDRVSRWNGTTLTPVITSGLRNPYELLRVPGGDIFISNYGLNNVLRWRQVAQASFTLPNSTSTFYVQRTVNGSPVGERVAITAQNVQGSLTSGGIVCNGTAGSLVFTATAGTGPFTVVYNDGTANRTVNNVASGVAFSVGVLSATTNYTLVSVTSATGCARTSGFTGGSATINVLSPGEINLQGAGSNIASGNTATTAANGTYLGILLANSQTAQSVFTVQNLGQCDLSVTSITSSNPFFTITGAPTSIPGGGSATFTVRYAPTAIGIHNTTITVNNNDTDEGTYTFVVRGIAGDCVLPTNVSGLDYDPIARSLAKTAANGWGNAAASSFQTIAPNTNGWVEWTVPSVGSGFYAAGLSETRANGNWQAISHGFFYANGQLYVVLNGNFQPYFGVVLQAGDRLRIARNGDRANFFHNNLPIFLDRNNHAISSSATLSFEVVMFSQGVSISGINSSQCGGAPLPAPCRLAWSNISGASLDPNAGMLTKTANTGWGNAGATSAVALAANTDGGIVWRIPDGPLDFYKYMLGLSQSKTGNDWRTMGYGIFYDAGHITVFISGMGQAYVGRVMPNDLLSVRREGDRVYFYRNNNVLYSAPVQRSATLVADLTMFDRLARVQGLQGINMCSPGRETLATRSEEGETKATSASHKRASGQWTATAWPNPTAGRFAVRVEGGEGAALFRLYDPAGKLLQEGALQGGETELDLNGRAAGLYLLRVSGEGFSQTLKVVKQ